MAKDPAVLFYTSDFLTGTTTMSYEQKGKYITLLCLQHQQTVLSEEDMLNICGSYDKKVFSKFVKTDEGYFNQRMRDEADKRMKYSQSRAKNRQKSETYVKDMNNISDSYVPHMENENEIVLVLTNKERVSFKKFLAYAKTISLYKPELDYAIESKYKAWAEAKGFDGNGKEIKNWKTTLRNTMPYLKPIETPKEETDREYKIRMLRERGFAV